MDIIYNGGEMSSDLRLFKVTTLTFNGSIDILQASLKRVAKLCKCVLVQYVTVHAVDTV